MPLGMKNLVGFLTAGDLKKSGRKVKFISLAFSAAELKLPILQSPEEQQKQFKFEYENHLATNVQDLRPAMHRRK